MVWERLRIMSGKVKLKAMMRKINIKGHSQSGKD